MSDDMAVLGMRRRALLVAIGVTILLVVGGCGALEPVPVAESVGSVELVGHDPLHARGMNAALAVHGDHAYIGSRSDVQDKHPHPGILAVDISDPAAPTVVAEFGVPDDPASGSSTRELRVWPAAELLIVLDHPCAGFLHDCLGYQPTRFRFFDIGGEAAAAPNLVSEYIPSGAVHEFFLWQDPDDSSRALLYSSIFDAAGDLLVTDISGARDAEFEELGAWRADFADPGPGDAIHSLSVSPDGARAYLAYLTAGFLVVDTSDYAAGIAEPGVRPITDLAERPQWDGPAAHSAVPIPGRELAFTTDEAYGTYAGSTGCPWAWSRIIDVADPVRPEVVGEYRVTPYNDPEQCGETPTIRNERSSFSAHNPTLTEHLALVTWHSAGLQIVDTSDPAAPSQTGAFAPEPLDEVATEDPALSSGPDKTVMWSYPIIRDGLIYVVDVRNGLYVLRYAGPHADEIEGRAFLEGNSNIGQ